MPELHTQNVSRFDESQEQVSHISIPNRNWCLQQENRTIIEVTIENSNLESLYKSICNSVSSFV